MPTDGLPSCPSVLIWWYSYTNTVPSRGKYPTEVPYRCNTVRLAVVSRVDCLTAQLKVFAVIN